MSSEQEDKLTSILEFVRGGGRICPQPMKWQFLWEMLPAKRQNSNGSWNPHLPLVLGAWWHSSDDAKQERLELHIRYAAEHGIIDSVDAFLRSLPAHEWHFRKVREANQVGSIGEDA